MAAYWAQRRGATHLRGLARPDVEAPFLEHGFTRVAERACDAATGLDVVPLVLDLRARSDRFLALLERERIGDAFDSFERQYHAAGDSIVREGERGDEAFVIVSGAVDVLVGGGDADPIRVATLGPGDLFGELSLLSDEPRSATVDAHTDVVLMVLGRDAFERQLSESPKTAKRLIRLIGARMAGRATGSATRPVTGETTAEVAPPPR
jgi:CRP-like cAMP-binding protein